MGASPSSSASNVEDAKSPKSPDAHLKKLLKTDREISELIPEAEFREAAKYNQMERMKELLREGVDVNCQHPEFGWTALHYASGYGRFDITQELLKSGARPDIKDYRHCTALHETAFWQMNDWFRCCAILINNMTMEAIQAKDKGNNQAGNYMRSPGDIQRFQQLVSARQTILSLQSEAAAMYDRPVDQAQSAAVAAHSDSKSSPTVSARKLSVTEAKIIQAQMQLQQSQSQSQQGPQAHHSRTQSQNNTSKPLGHSTTISTGSTTLYTDTGDYGIYEAAKPQEKQQQQSENPSPSSFMTGERIPFPQAIPFARTPSSTGTRNNNSNTSNNGSNGSSGSGSHGNARRVSVSNSPTRSPQSHQQHQQQHPPALSIPTVINSPVGYQEIPHSASANSVSSDDDELLPPQLYTVDSLLERKHSQPPYASSTLPSSLSLPQLPSTQLTRQQSAPPRSTSSNFVAQTEGDPSLASLANADRVSSPISSPPSINRASSLGQSAQSSPSRSDNITVFPNSELKNPKLVGSGNFGVAYVCDSIKHNKVVVKVPRVQTTQQDLKEFRACVRIPPHPNVVPLLGITVDFLGKIGTLCFIMQFVERGSLADLLKNKKLQFSFDSKGTFQLLVAARDLASGLAHLHTHGIVHRDVATRNLLVNEAGRVLLSDFGLSRVVSQEGDEGSDDTEKAYYRMDDQGTSMLPIRWLAPESLEDFRFTAKSDVWMAGITLYELVTQGQTPYGGLAPRKIQAIVLQSKHLDYLPLPAECPAALKSIIHACLTHDASKRPSATELVRILDGYIAQLSPAQSESSGNNNNSNASQSSNVSVKAKPNANLANSPSGANVWAAAAEQAAQAEESAVHRPAVIAQLAPTAASSPSHSNSNSNSPGDSGNNTILFGSAAGIVTVTVPSSDNTLNLSSPKAVLPVQTQERKQTASTSNAAYTSTSDMTLHWASGDESGVSDKEKLTAMLASVNSLPPDLMASLANTATSAAEASRLMQPINISASRLNADGPSSRKGSSADATGAIDSDNASQSGGHWSTGPFFNSDADAELDQDNPGSALSLTN